MMRFIRIDWRAIDARHDEGPGPPTFAMKEEVRGRLGRDTGRRFEVVVQFMNDGFTDCLQCSAIVC